MKLTGNKLDQKFYYRHRGIPGGFKRESYRDLLERKPEFPIEKAVKGMLPKNVLGRQMLTQAQGLRDARSPARGAEAQAPRRSQLSAKTMSH